MVEDPFAFVACDSSWTLPIRDPKCEQACLPRPELDKAECQAWNDVGATQHCDGTFTFQDGDGIPHTGCCGLSGDQTHPTALRFSECP